VVLVRVLAIFVGVLVHELGHALVTRSFGWYPEIVLYVLGGYTTATRHTTWKNVAVSAAGPAAGFVLYAAIRLGVPPLLQSGWRPGVLMLEFLEFSLFINLIWNVMNLLPVLPLDGGHICRDLLQWLSPRRADENALKVSVLVSGAVAVWALLSWQQHRPVLGLDPLFLGVMFGYLCYQSFLAYQAHTRGYW